MSIIMPPVPPAQPVRLVDQGIGCCNGALDLRRGISGGNGFPVVQHGRLAGHKVVGGKTRRSFNLLLGGTGREKKAGQKGTSHGESSVGRKCHKNYKLRNSRPLGKKINFPRPHYMVDGGKKSAIFSPRNGCGHPFPQPPTGNPGRPGPPSMLPSQGRPVSRARRGSI